ncbi:MAG: hypothetical protein B6I38_02785 [Anaerolineaceae bacterium 4572_5.1]|nr:MAG: hypothetical protein B6I38_02785 [Anaerolineaceae bacterium 4572_5.1]
MAKEESPKEIIDSYRKRRKTQGQSWKTTLIFILAALLVIIGLNFLIFWLTGTEISIKDIFASDTPTPTSTLTPTLVPPTATPTLTPTEIPPTNTPTITFTPTRSGAVIYIVQEGDSLYTIAERFEIDLLTLIMVNRDRPEFTLDPLNPIIRLGDELLIPAPGETYPSPTPIPYDAPPGMMVAYTVRPGDSVQSIALKLRSTVEDILERNEFIEEYQEGLLFVGQVINVRVNLVTPMPTVEGESTPVNTPGAISTLTPTAAP